MWLLDRDDLPKPERPARRPEVHGGHPPPGQREQDLVARLVAAGGRLRHAARIVPEESGVEVGGASEGSTAFPPHSHGYIHDLMSEVSNFAPIGREAKRSIGMTLTIIISFPL
jgi:hypothetical protein